MKAFHVLNDPALDEGLQGGDRQARERAGEKQGGPAAEGGHLTRDRRGNAKLVQFGASRRELRAKIFLRPSRTLEIGPNFLRRKQSPKEHRMRQSWSRAP